MHITKQTGLNAKRQFESPTLVCGSEIWR